MMDRNGYQIRESLWGKGQEQLTDKHWFHKDYAIEL